MNDKEAPADVEEFPETDVTAPSQQTESYPEETALTPFEGDFMEITIEVADHLEKYEKAFNTIMNFIIKQTYAGDWISHDKTGTSIEDRTANMSGAAAERVANYLGIQESNRTKPIKKWNEKHPGHYSYECEGDFEFRGRHIHAIGIASTWNPFYSKADGQRKDPDEIREEYIIRDCLRDCVKQGIKGMFGLRKIPIMKLKELGYDIAQIKYVNYQQGEKSTGKVNPDANAKPAGTETPETSGEQVEISIDAMKAKVSKGEKPFYSVTESEGANLYAWGKPEDEMIKKLLVAWRDKKTVQVMIKGAGGQFPTITGVL